MDPGFLAALNWSTLTPSGLLALVFLLVMLGFLVPKSYYQEKKNEADYWREAHGISEKARRKALVQQGVLINAVDRFSGQKDLGVAILESAKASGYEEEDTG